MNYSIVSVILDVFKFLASLFSWILFLVACSLFTLFGSLYLNDMWNLQLFPTAIFLFAISLSIVLLSVLKVNCQLKKFNESGMLAKKVNSHSFQELQPHQNWREVSYISVLTLVCAGAVFYYLESAKTSLVCWVAALSYLTIILIVPNANKTISAIWGISNAFSWIVLYFGFGWIFFGRARTSSGHDSFYIPPLLEWSNDYLLMPRMALAVVGMIGLILFVAEKDYLAPQRKVGFWINFLLFVSGSLPISLIPFIDCTPKEWPRLIEVIVCGDAAVK